MMRVLIYLFLLTANTHLIAQSENSITYLDQNRSVVPGKEGAKYYRVVEKSGEKFLVKDFYMSTGKMEREAECSQVDPQLVFDGWVRTYKEDGSPARVFRRKDKTVKYIQWWSQTGEPSLINGSGVVVEKNEAGYSVRIELRDSVLYTSYFARPDKGDTIFNISPTGAEFSGGLESFYSYLNGRLRYPQDAITNEIQGTVHVQFIVNKEGQLEEVKTIRSLSKSCDYAAELAVRSVPRRWTPAQFEGKAVKQIMTLPVIFRLEY